MGLEVLAIATVCAVSPLLSRQKLLACELDITHDEHGSATVRFEDGAAQYALLKPVHHHVSSVTTRWSRQSLMYFNMDATLTVSHWPRRK
jgi:hypothetical protein